MRTEHWCAVLSTVPLYGYTIPQNSPNVNPFLLTYLDVIRLNCARALYVRRESTFHSRDIFTSAGDSQLEISSAQLRPIQETGHTIRKPTDCCFHSRGMHKNVTTLCHVNNPLLILRLYHFAPSMSTPSVRRKTSNSSTL